MICIEYQLIKDAYDNSLSILHKVLLEKEELFTKTQPNAIRYDLDKVQSTPNNVLESYVQQLDDKRINERLDEARAIVKDRRFLLEEKQRELIESKEIHDIVYRYKHIDNIKIPHIAKMLGYSESQTYRILDKISQKLKDARKCENYNAIILSVENVKEEVKH